MLIDDLVVLGRACPNLTSDGRKTVCLGGYSQKEGFVRVYPTHPYSSIKRWDIVSVEVERNSRDTRLESWKIVGSKDEWRHLWKRIERNGTLAKPSRHGLIAAIAEGCVKDVNDRRGSLGIIEPRHIEGFWADQSDVSQREPQQVYQQTRKVKTKRDFDSVPRLKYECARCRSASGHNQQLLEWGAWEWMRKNPENLSQLWQNFALDTEQFDRYFLVGNQAAHRSSFMVISILRWKREAQMILF